MQSMRGAAFRFFDRRGGLGRRGDGGGRRKKKKRERKKRERGELEEG